mmetsp:Transcript_8681/g.27336  ORF Transcript_8681/g.27336 Transcript_8681/m.27336 type:complete len:215 (-) Transcript_8681:592-1236(-)
MVARPAARVRARGRPLCARAIRASARLPASRAAAGRARRRALRGAARLAARARHVADRRARQAAQGVAAADACGAAQTRRGQCVRAHAQAAALPACQFSADERRAGALASRLARPALRARRRRARRAKLAARRQGHVLRGPARAWPFRAPARHVVARRRRGRARRARVAGPVVLFECARARAAGRRRRRGHVRVAGQQDAALRRADGPRAGDGI